MKIADGGSRVPDQLGVRAATSRSGSIDTIYENFGIGIDHYIQVDFCAFKTLVDAVGGVTVPFEYPARDDNTGLNVPAPGCFTFDGDHALAYVRSRHYEYEDPPGSGNWKTDPTIGPRPHLAPAGLPAPHAGERPRQGLRSTRASLAG